MAEKKDKVRLKEIETELDLIKKKRLDFANYMNNMPEITRSVKRAYSHLQDVTFNQELKLLAEKRLLEEE